MSLLLTGLGGFRIWYLVINFPQIHYNKLNIDKQNLSIHAKIVARMCSVKVSLTQVFSNEFGKF